MSEIVSRSGFHVRYAAAAPRLSAYTAMFVAKLRVVAPYALIELILPGGSLLALLLWLYRRQRTLPSFPTDEILSLL
jgi:hypothetical protein